MQKITRTIQHSLRGKLKKKQPNSQISNQISNSKVSKIVWDQQLVDNRFLGNNGVNKYILTINKQLRPWPKFKGNLVNFQSSGA